MNERIKELAIEAGYLPDMFGVGHWDMPECKKFAELIVEECADWIVNNASAMEHLGPTYFAKAMQKDFGAHKIKVGSRVKVIAGFNVGALGIVNYIDPTGKFWVRRDGASSDVFYSKKELIGVEE
jgi:hypothetical protein